MTRANLPLVVSVDESGQLYINVGDDEDKPATAEDIVNSTRIVLTSQPGTPVLVKADRRVQYGYVVGAMVLLQQRRCGECRLRHRSAGYATRFPSSDAGAMRDKYNIIPMFNAGVLHAGIVASLLFAFDWGQPVMPEVPLIIKGADRVGRRSDNAATAG